jgi:hypothetical protein
MVAYLSRAGFDRILTERAVQGYGILSRGEKPYTHLSTVERISQTAALDSEVAELQVVDSAALDTVSRGRFVFLLVRQTPNKPQWALKPGEAIRWDAAMVNVVSTGSDGQGKPYLLAFTSLPKAVEFMQPAVTSGLIKDINKVAKFDKTVGQRWAAEVLINPTFEVLRQTDRFSFGASMVVDPASAVMGEE